MGLGRQGFGLGETDPKRVLGFRVSPKGLLGLEGTGQRPLFLFRPKAFKPRVWAWLNGLKALGFSKARGLN